VVPSQLQTSQNVQDLEKLQRMLGSSDTTPIRITRKVLKAATILQAQNLILHEENKEL
jgi:hypothetical protein